MKEYPILFKTEMVEAIWEGKKNITRRLVKRIPLDWLDNTGFDPEFVAMPENHLSPYGYNGDDLWVRETWTQNGLGYYRYRAGWKDKSKGPFTGPSVPEKFRGKWKPNIFMPKSICRTWLHNLGVRIERLQDITNEDAIAEGIDMNKTPCIEPMNAYAILWDSINGSDSWSKNPWVWVIKFIKYERNTVS